MLHIYRKFPEFKKRIEVFLQEDTDFQDICGDYQDASTWLSRHSCPKDLSCEECNHARELIGDLEEEISRALTDGGF